MSRLGHPPCAKRGEGTRQPQAGGGGVSLISDGAYPSPPTLRVAGPLPKRAWEG
jgi:hypothetical protein